MSAVTSTVHEVGYHLAATDHWRKMIKREDSHIASCSSPQTRGGTVNARHHPLLLIITRSTNTNEPPAHPVPGRTSQGSAMWKFYLPLSPASSNITISRWSLSPLAFSTCVGNEENIYCWRCSTFISNFHTHVATFLHVPSNVKSLRGNYIPLFENVECPLGTCWMFWAWCSKKHNPRSRRTINQCFCR